MLRCLQRTETDPFFNVAAEEHLLMNASTDTFMVWKNTPVIVVGKHQNTNREINHTLVSKLGIPVIRRITGGGTVYHDTGNINFSFIRLNRKENPVDFKFFTRPILLFLQSMGLDAQFEGKSNITVNGYKVSGNAAHVYRGRVLHHGTLLYDTDLQLLDEVLMPSVERYQDRSVRSIPKKVTNIASHLKAEMTAGDFMESFFSFIINYCQDAYQDYLSSEEYQFIDQLASGKYRDIHWNYGYSPDYQYSGSFLLEEGEVKISLSTREAIIENVTIEGPSSLSGLLKQLEVTLKGVLHEKKSVGDQLKKIKFASEKESSILQRMLQHMF